MTINRTQLAELEALLHDRVTTDLDERRIYSHDVGTLPRLVRPLIGAAIADAVVQPRTEAEIVEVIRWAHRHRVPLTPRAKATSGYGGCIPARGGVVVDLSRYRGVVAVDPGAQTVTVRAATVWRDLERELARSGLGLRLYPSSAPSSTVGGWLAQGGVGYGSFQYGPFRENVVSARVVTPDGEVRTFEGPDLDLVSDAEGTTGIILEVTLRVRPVAEERVAAVAFPSAQALAGALRALAAEALPLWSVSFINPKMAKLRRELPPRLEHGHPVPEARPELPDGYVVTLVGPAAGWDEIEGRLASIIEAHKGARLPAESVELCLPEVLGGHARDLPVVAAALGGEP